MRAIKLHTLLYTLLTLHSYGQLSNGLKAWYPFSGNANDMSGQNNNGTLVGNPALASDRFGFADCAYLFPGNASDYINISYSTDFNIAVAGAFTISLWYQGGSGTISDFEVLFEKNDSAISPLPTDYHLALFDLNKPSFGSQYSPIVMPLYAPPFPDPNWHHLAAIYDNKKWYIYEDDTLRQSDLTQMYGIFQSTGDLSIGKGFQGKIDDIRFYDRVVTANEIDQLFNLPGSCQPSGINETSETRFTIYPNPAHPDFTISCTKQFPPGAAIEVFEITGKKINIEVKTNLDKREINLLNVPDGLYLVKITTPENTIVQKLQIQN